MHRARSAIAEPWTDAVMKECGRRCGRARDVSLDPMSSGREGVRSLTHLVCVPFTAGQSRGAFATHWPGLLPLVLER
jgi:hypothetical protein